MTACRERCVGGPYGGHHGMCPDARECPLCEGPVPEGQKYCDDCKEDYPEETASSAYDDEPWDYGLDDWEDDHYDDD